MLSFNNLELVLGGNTLFNDVSLTIHHHQKVGLVGANGTGKTSLFKVIKKEIEVDQSTVSYPADLRISYLAQEIKGTEELAIDYVLSGDSHLVNIQNQINDAEKNGDYEKLGELYDVFSSLDGYSAKSRAEQLLVGLGFKSNEFNKPLKAFSGGWRVRLNLAKTLMQPSDLMLLDEPTNHLDLDAILWLSNWIKHFQGALILISHDRDFLDDCVTFVAHLHRQSIEIYKGNYSQFESLRALKMAEIQSNYIKQQKEVAHMQSFINRFKAKATKARQAQSRIKSLEKMELIAPAHIDSPFNFKISETDKISNPLVAIRKAKMGYLDPILTSVDFTICPGDRVGLLGPNGAGKSTLIKSIVGDLKLLDGDRETGANFKVGYFSQHQVDDLDLTISAFTHIQRLDETKSEKQIRTYLGGFNFKGDKVKDSIRLFSGGEKARLAFAIISYQKPNILLMDEPTNHLDAESVLRHWAIHQGVNLSILRVPGIYGPNRLPIERLNAKTPALTSEEDAYSNHIHADDLARLVLGALFIGKPQRIVNACDGSEQKMGDYFDEVATALNLPKPKRLSREEVRSAVSPMLWSFMSESRRVRNARLTELKRKLLYPKVADYLKTLKR